MVVHNETRGCIVAPEVRVAGGVFSQLIGLIGRKEFVPGTGLWLPFCSGIHTLFLRFPIDVVMLDSKLQVIAVVEHLKPWRYTPLYLKARFALELPAGTVAVTETRVGDRFRVEGDHPKQTNK